MRRRLLQFPNREVGDLFTSTYTRGPRVLLRPQGNKTRGAEEAQS